MVIKTKKRNQKEQKPQTPFKFCQELLINIATTALEQYMQSKELKKLEDCKEEAYNQLSEMTTDIHHMSNLSNITFANCLANDIAFEEAEPEIFEFDNWNRKIIKSFKGRIPVKAKSINNKQPNSRSNSKLSVLSKRKLKPNRNQQKYLAVDFNKTKVSMVSKDEVKLRSTKITFKPIKSKKRRKKKVVLKASIRNKEETPKKPKKQKVYLQSLW